MTGQVLEAESRFRIMADSAPVMMWMADTSRGCNWFNACWLQFTGRPMEQQLGFGWADGVHPEDRADCLAAYFAAFEARKTFRMEYRLRQHDGAWRCVLDHGAPRFEPDGRFVGYIGSCIDVHERHEHAAELRAMLRDREVLLREVHHRVKNNFQIVMSMIGLRSTHLDAESREGMVLRELQARIGIMAAIQDELVSQPHADRIDFAGQLHRLISGMSTLHDGSRVLVVTEIDPLAVPVDRALSLGLIATELLSNAYRHAFRARQGVGRLWVSLRQSDGLVEMTMRDDGPGIPPVEARPRSVGLQIVQALAAQAEGEVAVHTAPSSTVQVRMKALA